MLQNAFGRNKIFFKPIMMFVSKRVTYSQLISILTLNPFLVLARFYLALNEIFYLNTDMYEAHSMQLLGHWGKIK